MDDQDGRLDDAVAVLERRPLEVLDGTKVDDLLPEFVERLEALLEIHRLEPDLAGWRELAIMLALAHEPAFQITTTAEPEPGPGADRKSSRFFLKWALRDALKTTGGNKAAAARVVKAKFSSAPSTKTLENMFKEDIPAPDSFRRGQYELTAKIAAMRAAEKLGK